MPLLDFAAALPPFSLGLSLDAKMKMIMKIEDEEKRVFIFQA